MVHVRWIRYNQSNASFRHRATHPSQAGVDDIPPFWFTRIQRNYPLWAASMSSGLRFVCYASAITSKL